jgi:hypothetical protein
VRWLHRVWTSDGVAEALDHASPVLAREVRVLWEAETPSVREARRAVLATVRYVLRLEGRPTPFGLLAGVAPASFGTDAQCVWGCGDRAVARAGAEWLAEVVARLEQCPELLARVPVISSSTLLVRGDRLIVPYQARSRERETGAVDASLRYTVAVRTAVRAARSPIPFGELSAKLLADFPGAPAAKVVAMLSELLRRGALITGLRAPSTQIDALEHVLVQLDAVEATAPCSTIWSGSPPT